MRANLPDIQTTNASKVQSWLEALSGLDLQSAQSYLRTHSELICRESVVKITDKIPQIGLQDTERADRFEKIAEWIADELNDDFCRARNARAAGHLRSRSGQYQQAVDSYDSAVALFERMEQQSEMAITLSSSLQPLMYLGHYDQAFSNAERARVIFKAQGDKLRLARLDVNLGNVLNRQDRFDDALVLYRRAEPILESFAAYSDQAIVLMNIAVCTIGLFDFPSAVAAYSRARELCNTQQIPLLAAQADYNIAYLYYLRGEYARAITLYRDSRTFCASAGDAYHAALCDLDQSEMYLDLNLADEAERLAWQAFAGFEELGLGYEAAKSMAFLGVASIQKGNLTQALQFLEKAQERFITQQNAVWPALLDLYRAVCYFREDRLFEARRNTDRALTFFSHSRLPGKAVIAQLLRATLHLKSGEHVEARYWVDTARYTAEKSKSLSLRYLCDYVLGTVQEASGAIEDAHASYQRSRKALETLPRRHSHEELKIPFLEDKSAIYQAILFTASSASANQNELLNDESTFNLVEKVKTCQIADTHLVRYGRDENAPEEKHSPIAQRVASMREEMNWLHKRIDVEELRPDRKQENLEILRQKASQQEALLIHTLDELKASGQDHIVSQSINTAPLADFFKVLPANATFLEYFEVRDILYVCALNRDSVETVALTPCARAKRLVQTLRQQFVRFKNENDSPAPLVTREAPLDVLKQLYAELIAPVRAFLQGEQLIVATHDFLQHLPFHALHNGARYLIDEFAVSYAPSASIYCSRFRKNALPQSRSLIVELTSSNADHNEAESSVIATLLPNAELLSAKSVTLEELNRCAAGCTVVHFLQTAPQSSSDAPSFKLSDLPHMNWDCGLITIPNAGATFNTVDEVSEIMRTARGLVQAGANSVLTDQWPVPEGPRMELLRSFYALRAENTDAAFCLHKAMRNLRETYSHPFYWSAYLLMRRAEIKDDQN